MSIFRGHNQMALEAGHPLLAKWLAVNASDGDGLGDEFRHMQASVRQIEAVNITINRRIKYQLENARSDEWQAPRRTLEIKTGDCEDIAILKYATVYDLGLSQGLTVVVGSIVGRGDHAFCVASVASGAWVMDNLFDRPIAPDQYVNFTPRYGFSGAQAFRYGRAGSIAEALGMKRA